MPRSVTLNDHIFKYIKGFSYDRGYEVLGYLREYTNTVPIEQNIKYHFTQYLMKSFNQYEQFVRRAKTILWCRSHSFSTITQQINCPIQVF